MADARDVNGLTRPLMLFDGDCGFCRTWVARWRLLTRDEIEYLPYQQAAHRFPSIPPGRFARAVHLIEPDGEVTEGAEAVLSALAHAPGHGLGIFLYDHLPGFAPAAERTYRLVADHRDFFTRATRLLWGESAAPSTFLFTRWLFLRALGLIFLAAFLSIAVQMEGLLGSQGILPAATFLHAVAEQVGRERFYFLPTIFWLNSSDAMLRAVPLAGAALSLLLVAGVATPLVLPLLWFGYLSIVTVGRDFLSFQWDILLLECGLLAMVLAAPGWRPGFHRRRPPSGLAVGLFQFLLFRLMFGSGWVKLASGDPTWRHLAALDFHYETQPLPTPLAWYAHQLPHAFQQASCLVMLGVELVAPLLVFAPPRARRLAFAPLVGLQILILLTGNYTFFNALAISLCLFLVDDAAWKKLFGRWQPAALHNAPALPGRAGAGRKLAGVVLLIAALSVFAGQIVGWRAVPSPARALVRWTSPFDPANTYGLFAVMTTTRPEIVVEGSADGETWVPYEFKYKPGDLYRAPSWVAPHEPRLDWQMWFASLAGFRATPWFGAFLSRLLEGSPPVLDLLADNPFPDEPPQAVRARLYLYRFTDRATRQADGAWWARKEEGPYSPVMRRPAGRR